MLTQYGEPNHLNTNMTDTKRKELIRDLIESGSEITGGAISSAIGFFAAGPIGAAVLGAGGAAASVALMHVGNELSERLLGPREKMRIGATLAFAAKEIDERIKNGENIRSDSFFEKKGSNRSGAEELAESVLLRTQRETEEKKVPLLAHLLANISFKPEISVALGEQMIKATDLLTYRQLCILRIGTIKDRSSLRQIDYHEQKTFTRDLYQVLHECLDLYNRGFIRIGSSAVLGMTDINPSQLEIQGLGVDLHNWMQLWKIPNSDIAPVVAVLSI